MSRVVLDTNCIIDLEEDRADAPHLRALVAEWKAGHIELAVVAVSASENQPDGAASRSYDVFVTKLQRAGLSGVHELLPPAIWGVFYWDHALWTSPEMVASADRIRAVLFPGLPVVLPASADVTSRWRNQLCDVFVAWSCIHHGWPCLITRDKNFHDHGRELAALGLTDVLSPAAAVQRFAP